jgi:hypothetical protein
VYLRRYSDARGGFWAKDVMTYRNVQDGEYTFSLRGGPSKPSGQRAPTAPGGQIATASGGSAAATGGSTAIAGSNNVVVTGDEYDLRVVRELLGAAFSDEEIVTLAFDCFRDVYEEIEGESSKPKKIRRLVDWCNSQIQMDKLLAEVKQRNPNQYARFASRLRQRMNNG